MLWADSTRLIVGRNEAAIPHFTVAILLEMLWVSNNCIRQKSLPPSSHTDPMCVVTRYYIRKHNEANGSASRCVAFIRIYNVQTN